MFWPILLPLKITCVCLIALVMIATWYAPSMKWKRPKTFFIAVALAGILFVPSCAGIQTIVDLQRFGVFEYDTFADVKDFRVERYPPPTASSITVDKNPAGFRAKFTITEPELLKYMDETWVQYGHVTVNKREEAVALDAFLLDSLDQRFENLGWPSLTDAVEYDGPRAPNGAGFTIWHSADKGIAYLSGGYW